MDSTEVVQALIVAGIIMDAKMQDLRDRIIRIENYLNGLLKIHETEK